ncbi:MAG TPA: TMEM165/GDT1 family protein, partial [Acidimicrobiales bacterium]|nr:TMEM165/GDT1 family protein [Acidimicrobiales bacterium]
MSPLVALATFGLVFPAELPDKTFIASLVLGWRLAPWPAWAGVAAAFAVHSAISVAAGSLLGLAPRRVVDSLVAASFLAGAAWLLAGRGPGAGARKQAEGAARATTPARAAGASFAVIFLAEWGD